MIVTKIQIENDREDKKDLYFSSGDYTSPQWIEMSFNGEKYTVDIEEIMDALIPFQAKHSRSLSTPTNQ